MGGNVVTRLAILQSGVPRPNRAPFLWECTFLGWKDGFFHGNARSWAAVNLNLLIRNTGGGHAKIERG